MSYLLLVIFLPVFGIIFYFSVGVNYRNRKMYSKKFINDAELNKQFKSRIIKSSKKVLQGGDETVQENKALAKLLLHDDVSPLTRYNAAEILINGEEKFPRVLEALEAATHHIHMEYYIYEPDRIGNKIADVLIRKAKEGVEVRLIYDDFGSRKIRRKLVARLRAAGVDAMPFYKIKLIFLANRLNYRNHRKIIIVDGKEAFVGGINVSDDYINYPEVDDALYWRDMHMFMTGPVVLYLQHLFVSDWNFCVEEKLLPSRDYFPEAESLRSDSDLVMQVAASGPDSPSPTILYSIMQAIMLADHEILITTPYFIPGESLMDLLVISAKSGISVHLMVPDKGDSWVVSSAAQSYYQELLAAGVKIHRYTKGFVHSKTMVIDQEIVMIGTANMDIRSFDLNFEVNAVIYDTEMGKEMKEIFFDDARDSIEINLEEWGNRPLYIQLLEKITRLVSPLL